MTSKSAPNYIKGLNIVSVDNANKKFKVKYGGAISGHYTVSIRHARYGLIDTSSLTLKVESQTTSISPTTGSMYGGTLVTLKGTNWGKQKTDNPVQIFYGGGVGLKSTNCYVQSTSATEIKCRVDPATNKTATDKGTMITFLKTYEEANCTMQPNCEYKFTDQIPDLTSAAAEWDTNSHKYHIKIEGTGFSGTSATTEFIVAGRPQVIKSQTATELRVEVSNVTASTITGAQLFFDIGQAKNFAKVTAATFKLEPKLVQISP
jgi:hypothetical protein